ncbi:MAG: family 10 glycosylhydrolase [Clostridia bacterium]|nr:family 10 glycosylhydrolase [Clostridia bacterium]
MVKINISHFGGARGADELVVYDKGERTATNKFGWEACIKDGRVVLCGGNDNLIPQGGYVVSGHGKIAALLAKEICIGAMVTIEDGNVLVIERDALAETASARAKIETIQNRVCELEKNKTEYDIARVTALISDAENALENGEFEKVDSLTTQAYYYTASPAQNEVRGAWLRPREKSDEEVEKAVARLADAGINLILVETNYGGFANALRCVNELLPPQKEYENGFDVIESYIRNGKKYGMQVHAWFEDYFFGSKGSPCAVANAHPEWMAKRKDGGLFHDAYDIFYFLNPVLSEVKEFLLSCCKDILDKYDFDGLQLDYIRYPLIHGIDRAAGFDEYTVNTFLGETGIDIRNIESTEDDNWKTFVRWCAGHVTEYVQSVRTLVDEYKKAGREVCLSTAVFGDPKAALYSKCQDWQNWIEQGWLDAIYPMAYYSDACEVEKEVAAMVQKYASVPNISGIAPMYSKLPVIETTKQVEACRRAGAKGVAFFAAGNCRDEELESLKIGVYRK